MSIAQLLECLPTMYKALGLISALYKLFLALKEVKARSEVQDHRSLYSKFEVSLSYMTEKEKILLIMIKH